MVAADEPEVSHARRIPGFARVCDGRFRREHVLLHYDSGLDRGFTHYEDYVLETLPAIRTARLVDLWFKSLAQLGESLPTNPLVLQQITREDRKEAREVNREFLEWLKERRQPERPFFAFLNYVNAHALMSCPRARRAASAPCRRPPRFSSY